MTRHFLTSIALSLAAILEVVCLLLPAATVAQNESSVYQQVEPSLAFVLSESSGKLSTGTAFCIASANGKGYLLTNHHVISGDPKPRVVLMSDPKKILNARVVRVAETDAAILEIGTFCPALTLSSDVPSIGTRIALAGFPSIQVTMALNGMGLAPSFHEGNVSAILASRTAIEYDAQTDHGNSGSPLFDASTGQVYGVVTLVNTGETGALQNNIAISTQALEPFLRNAKLHIVNVRAGPSVPIGESSVCTTDNVGYPAPGCAASAISGWIARHLPHFWEYCTALGPDSGLCTVNNVEYRAAGCSVLVHWIKDKQENVAGASDTKVPACVITGRLLPEQKMASRDDDGTDTDDLDFRKVDTSTMMVETQGPADLPQVNTLVNTFEFPFLLQEDANRMYRAFVDLAKKCGATDP